MSTFIFRHVYAKKFSNCPLLFDLARLGKQGKWLINRCENVQCSCLASHTPVLKQFHWFEDWQQNKQMFHGFCLLCSCNKWLRGDPFVHKGSEQLSSLLPFAD